MIQLSLSAVAKEASLPHPTAEVVFHGISIDTRSLSPKNLFVAIPGERVDGHDCASDAIKKGASALLVNRPLDLPVPQLIVDDTILALGKIAGSWRDTFSLPVIGVTGSNGKTTLKNMIASILRAACWNDAKKVLSTEGNFNNNIGLPLTLSQLNADHRYAVIEMGMNHFGEIAYLTQIAKPQVAVINNAGPAHLAYLHDVAGVARAKGEIFLGLPKDGTAVLNRDDAFFDYWKDLIKTHSCITFGLHASADVCLLPSNASPITIKTPRGNIDVILPLLGKHNVMNALAATATTLALNINLNAIKTGLENVRAIPGRLHQHILANGVRIIDDTYNANPESVTAAIHTLAELNGNNIFILGDMGELGSNAVSLHVTIGETAKKAGIHHLFTLGKLSENATKQFGKDGIHFTEREKLIEALQPYLQPNTNILIKGARSMRMEKIVAMLCPDIEMEHH